VRDSNSGDDSTNRRTACNSRHEPASVGPISGMKPAGVPVSNARNSAAAAIVVDFDIPRGATTTVCRFRGSDSTPSSIRSWKSWIRIGSPALWPRGTVKKRKHQSANRAPPEADDSKGSGSDEPPRFGPRPTLTSLKLILKHKSPGTGTARGSETVYAVNRFASG